MQRAPQLSWLWLLALLALLGLLAVLQFRWIGEVSRGEKARLEASLQRAATHFSADFDLEISRLFFWFQGRELDEVAEAATSWRAEAPLPQILRDVLVVDRPGDPQARRLNEALGRFEPIPFSADLEPLRHLASRSRRRLRLPAQALLADEIPALVVPARPPLVLRLDTRALSEQLLPLLLERHFPGDAGLDYDVGVFDHSRPPQPIYVTDPEVVAELRSEPPINTLFRVRPFEELSSVRHFPFARRFEPPRGPRGDPRRPGAEGPPPFGANPPLPPGAWQLRTRHRQGSLDRAVARLRRRNLAVSISVLMLLASSGAFLVLSTRRAQALARQQVDFIAGLTHELHTPLAAIEAASSNLADRIVEDPDRVQTYGALIQREGRRLSDLVSQALTLAGVRSGATLSPRDLEIAPLIDDVLAANRWLIEKRKAKVSVDLEPGLRRVQADPEALRRVLSNLLGNALKYGGGEVVLRARRVGNDARAKVQIEVADDGPGFPAAEMARVFDPFYRGRNARDGQERGSGIGLHLARELVEQQGGRIGARNLPRGAVVSFELPAAEAAD